MATTDLPTLRGDLAEALGCADHVPDVIDPPTVVIGPGDPYVTPGDTFPLVEAAIALEVYVLVEITDGATMLNQVDQALPAVLATVRAQGWGIDAVSRPDTYTTADWTAYGVRIDISRFANLAALATPAVPTFTLS